MVSFLPLGPPGLCSSSSSVPSLLRGSGFGSAGLLPSCCPPGCHRASPEKGCFWSCSWWLRCCRFRYRCTCQGGKRPAADRRGRKRQAEDISRLRQCSCGIVFAQSARPVDMSGHSLPRSSSGCAQSCPQCSRAWTAPAHKISPVPPPSCARHLPTLMASWAKSRRSDSLDGPHQFARKLARSSPRFCASSVVTPHALNTSGACIPTDSK